jgi:hypothetical protein
VQSYILVERSLKDDDLGANSIVQEFLHVVSSSFSFILFVLNVGTSESWIQVVGNIDLVYDSMTISRLSN